VFHGSKDEEITLLLLPEFFSHIQMGGIATFFYLVTSTITTLLQKEIKGDCREASYTKNSDKKV